MTRPPLVPAVAAALLAGCATAHPIPAATAPRAASAAAAPAPTAGEVLTDEALADRAADCSAAYSLFILTTRDTGDAERIGRAEPLVRVVGYWVAAGRALSTEAHATARHDATVGRYLDQRDAIPRTYAEDVRRRRFLDALAVDMAECAVLQREQKARIGAALKAYLARAKEERR